MSIKAKTKGFIKIKGINLTSYATLKGTSKSNLHQKIIKDKIYLKDLVELCSEYNCRVSIIDNRTDKELVSYNEYDIDPTMDPADKETKE